MVGDESSSEDSLEAAHTSLPFTHPSLGSRVTNKFDQDVIYFVKERHQQPNNQLGLNYNSQKSLIILGST